jgi:succinate dehydrogenase / fumarate reductase, cytochrome b subunit
MSAKSSVVWSSVGKKLITGLTGVLLVGFVVMHLLGNLTLLVGGDAFNEYADFLAKLGHGKLLTVAELGLVVIFGSHIVSGVSVALRRQKARPEGYQYHGNAGGVSKKSASSQSMIYTGTVLAIFLIVHVWQFRLGPVYETTLHGEKVRDLYKLVVETFSNGAWVGFYVAVMLMLGFHLRHGFWSMFQSLGLTNKRLLPVLVPLGVAVAVLLAVGFLSLPVYLNMTAAHTPQITTGGLP